MSVLRFLLVFIVALFALGLAIGIVGWIGVYELPILVVFAAVIAGADARRPRRA